MSDDKKNEKQEKAAAKPPAVETPKGMPVKILRLVRATQLPGYPQTDVIATQKMPDRREWTIEYIPQMRHHRIDYYNPNATKEEDKHRVGFVHETHVSVWEPLAL